MKNETASYLKELFKHHTFSFYGAKLRLRYDLQELHKQGQIIVLAKLISDKSVLSMLFDTTKWKSVAMFLC